MLLVALLPWPSALSEPFLLGISRREYYVEGPFWKCCGIFRLHRIASSKMGVLMNLSEWILRVA